MPQKQRKKIPQGTKICGDCRKEKRLSNFYQVPNSQASSDGQFSNVCKNCIKKHSINPDGSLNIEEFKKMLQLMDRAYVPIIVDSAIEETQVALSTGRGRKDLIGNYIKDLNLSQYSKISFLQSMQLSNKTSQESSNAVTVSGKRQKTSEEVYISPIDDFVVTNDILDLFGEGFKKNEYRLMKKKFDKMISDYPIQTNLHQEALVTYVRFKVKEELATASGNVAEADKWNKAAQDAADKAKLTPKQLSQADINGGISSFSELSLAVEQIDDIVKILPKFKYQPNDAADFIIWCYIEYVRKLSGLPPVKYEEVYKFYDDKKEEYLAQYGDPYGIFTNDPSESNRDNVKKFITLPEDYNYSDDGKSND